MLIETLILALAAGFISAGRIRNLGGIDIRFPGLIIAGLLIRNIPAAIDRIFPTIRSLSLLKDNWIEIHDIAAVFFLVSYVILIFGLYFNLHEWPMYLIFSGTIMNFLVVAANGGFMPVASQGLIDAGYPFPAIPGGLLDLNHVMESADTRLMFLADVIPLVRPYPLPKMLSFGDILMCIGLFLLIFLRMHAKTEKRIFSNG